MRLGITIARPAQRATSGTVVARAASSRRWMCQSSGNVSVNEVMIKGTRSVSPV